MTNNSPIDNVLTPEEWTRVFEALEYHYDTGDTIKEHEVNCDIVQRLGEAVKASQRADSAVAAMSDRDFLVYLYENFPEGFGSDDIEELRCISFSEALAFTVNMLEENLFTEIQSFDRAYRCYKVNMALLEKMSA